MSSTIDCPKCGHEHEPTGSHEDDAGEWICEQCEFQFWVEIDYDPYYTTACSKHEFGDYGAQNTSNGPVMARFCKHCGACEIKPEHPAGRTS